MYSMDTFRPFHPYYPYIHRGFARAIRVRARFMIAYIQSIHTYIVTRSCAHAPTHTYARTHSHAHTPDLFFGLYVRDSMYAPFGGCRPATDRVV